MARGPAARDVEAIIAATARRGDVGEVTFRVASPRLDDVVAWKAPGARRQHFIASSTKLFTLAILLRMRERRWIAFETRAAEILPSDLLRGLNTVGGVDHWEEYTVEQLLAHTTGIPDYFEAPRDGGPTFVERMVREDFGWSLADALEEARRRRATFAPGRDRAVYSDTNYQLLGAIVEGVSGRSFADTLVAEVLDPLGLADTYLFTDATLARYDTISPILFGARSPRLPRAMASFGPDGGIVSTTADCMRFLRAFAGGELFAPDAIGDVTARWNRVFTPLRYGVGIMRYELPALLTGFRKVPPMIGHSGASGHVMFWAPGRDLFVVGTVNQAEKRSLPYRTLTRIAIALR
jgi:CubicO group peptidase (beta-lactamase class C family)